MLTRRWPHHGEPPLHRLAELARCVGATLDGDGSFASRAWRRWSAPGPATSRSSPIRSYRAQLATTRACAVIVAPGDRRRDAAAEARLVQSVRDVRARRGDPASGAAAAPGVHATARVDAAADVAASASIGAVCRHRRARAIGERAVVGAHCVVGDDATIGDDALLIRASRSIARCVIGARTHRAQRRRDRRRRLRHGATTAGAGIKIPQIGARRRSATTSRSAPTPRIDRGAIDDTVIEDDVKLDNQIQVGHNCAIGAHTAIAGCVGIAGSDAHRAQLQDRRRGDDLRPLTIADGTRDLGGDAWSRLDPTRRASTRGAFPVLPHREWQHAASKTRRLRGLAERLPRLERERGIGAADEARREDEA